MYFPSGFSRSLSIELAELIAQAYAQFEALESEVVWKLPAKYSLIAEVTYIWTPGRAIERGIRNFDLTLRKLSRSGRPREIRIPIGFVAGRRNALFLILRGTQTVKEWIRNFSLSLNPYPTSDYGKVHGGFLQTYGAVRENILGTLRAADSRADLYVAGHSLGAALTTLAVPDIEANLSRKVSAIYTYGSPRVGDNGFAKAFNRTFGERSFRVANTSDIVTSIPLPAPIAGLVGGYFSHVDAPVDLTVQLEDLEKNHSMSTYLSAMRENKVQKGLLEKLFEKNV